MPPSTPTIGMPDRNSGAQRLSFAARNTPASVAAEIRSVRDKPAPLSSTKPASLIFFSCNHCRTTCSPRALVESEALAATLLCAPSVKNISRVIGLSERFKISRLNSASVRDWCSASKRVSAVVTPSRAAPAHVPPNAAHIERNNRSAKSTRSSRLIAVFTGQLRGNSPFSVTRIRPSSILVNAGSFQKSSQSAHGLSTICISESKLTRSNAGVTPTRKPDSSDAISSCIRLLLSSNASGITL